MLFVRPDFFWLWANMFIWLVKASVRLAIGVIMAGAPASLVSAQLERITPHWTSSTVFFESANACMWAGIAPRICQAAHRSAFRQHLRAAPVYRELADCEADFFPGECFAVEATRLWSPWLSGFALITRAQLILAVDDTSPGARPQPSGNRDEASDTQAQVRYFSEPLYWESDHQGGSQLTSLREKLRDGEHFDKAFTRHAWLQAGSPASDRRLARMFEPQRLFHVAAP